MATAAWPATLPQCPILNFTEQAQPNLSSFRPEVGPPKIRRRSTAKVWLTNVTFRMNNTQLLAFYTFYETTLQDGSLPFTMQHPRTTVQYTWAFDPSTAPQITRVAPRASAVTCNLMRLP